MRRRWKTLVAVGAVAFLAGIFLLVQPHDDGFDWIRKYGGRERKKPDTLMIGPGSPVKLIAREFTFTAEPSLLLAKLKRMSADELLEKSPSVHLAGSLPDGSIFTWEPEELRLSMGRMLAPNWLDLAWFRFVSIFV